MRISDWSSDVCSSDLGYGLWRGPGEITRFMEEAHAPLGPTFHRLSNFVVDGDDSRATARTYVDALMMPASQDGTKIGRAHVSTTVTYAQLVCRLLLEKKNSRQYRYEYSTTQSISSNT